MNDEIQQEKKVARRYYEFLKGAKITDVEVREHFGEVWTVLTIKRSGWEPIEVEISMDEEGNGPGYLCGLPVPGSVVRD